MVLRPSPFTIQLRHVFSLAAGARTSTPAVILEVEQDGVIGFGEASMPPYIGEKQEEAMQFLAGLTLPRFPEYGAILRYLEDLDRRTAGFHAARAALDIALHDWWGRRCGLPCHALLGVDVSRLPFTSMTIGMGEKDFLEARVQEARDFPVLKIKLGGGNDRAIVGIIRGVTSQPLRVDANQGWKGREEALAMIEWLAGRGVELVEQPLPKERIGDLRWLKERSPLPVVADESVARFADLEKVADAVHGVNIKLMKCTGMAEAHRMILRARELGMKVMLGCMTETSCGISAAAQLVGLADWADLDGALLIANDPFEGVEVRGGEMVLSGLPGIGVQLKRVLNPPALP